MLSNLHVKNFAIIDELDVSFGEHLNILSGETGAGKSVIIGSINLALGAKASGALIRTGCEWALVELVFDVDGETEDILRAMDVYPEEGQVVISRRIQEAKSVSKINGETVTLNTVKAVAAVLLDIHGQHEHQSLLNNKNHLSILDRYCGHEAAGLLYCVSSEVKKLKEAENEKKELLSLQDRRELDFLEYEINEIEELAAREGEEEELAALLKKMYNGKKLADALLAAKVYTGTDEGAGEFIGNAVKELSYVSGIDEECNGFYERLLEIEDLVRDFNHSVADYAESCIYDEEKLAETEERLDAIRNVFAKHGGSYESLMSYYDEAVSKAEKLRNFEDSLKEMDKKIGKITAELTKICDDLSSLRKKNALILEEKIREALVDLNFLDVAFKIDFTETDGFTEKGTDIVNFLISTNPGEPVRPLADIASGGELSRIMLAIKSVMADADNIPSLIFDEIDTGISGRTAQKVAEKMAQIARAHQVFAITHLAQIAAMADTHFLIEKSVQGDRTSTAIRKLSVEEQTEELARILGGAQITESVMTSAKEMKTLANEMKISIKTQKSE